MVQIQTLPQNFGIHSASTPSTQAFSLAILICSSSSTCFAQSLKKLKMKKNYLKDFMTSKVRFNA